MIWMVGLCGVAAVPAVFWFVERRLARRDRLPASWIERQRRAAILQGSSTIRTGHRSGAGEA